MQSNFVKFQSGPVLFVGGYLLMQNNFGCFCFDSYGNFGFCYFKFPLSDLRLKEITNSLEKLCP